MAYVYLVTCLFNVFFLNLGWAECVEKKKFIPTEGHIGVYLRVHPSGNYVLSTTGRVQIFDLTQSPARVVATPMQSETYPVEGSWRLLASPNHDNGMRYYSFVDVMSQQGAAAPVFNDREHNQYYHSAAEFPDSTAEKMKFRTVLWSKLKYRDYTVSTNDGVATVEKSEIKSLCSTITEPGHTNNPAETEKRARLAELGNRQSQIEQEYARAQNSWNTANNRDSSQQARNRMNDLQSQWTALDQQLRALRQELGISGGSGQSVSQPIVSKDGQFIAATVYNQARNGQSTQILKIEGHSCVRLADTGFSTGKVSFAYPDGGSPRIAFTGSGLSAEERPPTLTDQEVQAVVDRDANVAQYVRDQRARGTPEETIREAISSYLGRGNGGGMSVYTFDVGSKKIQKVSDNGDGPSYPGYTKDGRIVYGGYQSGRPGFFIVDPNQMAGGSGQCITKEQAAAAAGTAAAH